MSKPFAANIGIRPAKIKREIANPQTGTNGTPQSKKSTMKEVMEEIFNNMVKMSDDLKYLL